MKARLLPLILCLFIITHSNAQHRQATMHAQLNGTVLDIITDEALSNAEVTLLERKVTWNEDGIPNIHSIYDAKRQQVIHTDTEGQFAFNVSLRTATDYYALLVQQPDKESQIISIVELKQGMIKTLEAEISPLEPTEEEERIIEEKWLPFWHQKNADKASDTRNPYTTDPVETIPENELAQRGSCTYSGIPTSVYVSNLINGYNSSTSGSGYYGYINFDEYVAGVIQGEIGGITTNLDVKKAQAIPARTFSQRKHELGYSVNIGQAYNSNISSTSLSAATGTSQEVITYGGSIVSSNYAARCNGNYTQNSNQGTWAPYSNCNLSGTLYPYLVSRPCSGHISCGSTSESPCCNVIISTVNTYGYIYGHGVGMCQRGIEQWGEIYNLNYCDILDKYYTGICVANTNCSTGSGGIPNMVIQSMWTVPASPVAGQPVDLYVKIKNAGTGDANNISLDHRIGLTNTVGTDTHPSLAPGATRDEFLNDYVFSSAGNYQYCVFIDPVAGETSTLNNSYCIDVTVGSGPTCNYSLSSNSASHGAGSATGSFSVNTTSGCAWTANESCGWVSITGGASGSGSGSVSYSINANTSSNSRSCTITVAGNSFVINQSGVGSKLPPVAMFGGNPLWGDAPLVVDFNDLSANNPTSWYWVFNGGFPDNSNVKNPQNIVYFDPGSYPVYLNVTNAYGADNLNVAGYVTVFAPTGINETSLLKDLIVYPNPGNGQFVIELNAAATLESELEIYDAKGQLMRTTPQVVHQGSNAINVDITDLAKGNYLVVIKHDGEWMTVKVGKL